MVFDEPKIAIVGAGAVGGYYGCMLAHKGYDVHFLARSDFDAVSKHGYEVRQAETSFSIYPAQVHSDSHAIGVCDLVIVAVKTTANDKLEAILRPLLGKNTYVVTLQNGMGNVENLAQFMPVEHIVGGLCFVCINRTAPGVIENYLPGQVHLGEICESGREATAEIVTMLSESGVKTVHTRSFEESQWRKLCWNIPFNGLAIAGGGITTDLILKSAPLKEHVWALMREVQKAACKAGIDIPDDYLQYQFKLTEPMGAYKPSSLIDYLEGRDVEVESIWGEPFRKGDSLGISMPHLQSLYWLVKHLVDNRKI